MKIWKLMNVFWTLIFMVGVAFLLLRKVDGASVVQTPEMRVIAIGILVLLFVVIAIIQFVWGRILKKQG